MTLDLNQKEAWALTDWAKTQLLAMTKAGYDTDLALEMLIIEYGESQVYELDTE